MFLILSLTQKLLYIEHRCYLMVNGWNYRTTLFLSYDNAKLQAKKKAHIAKLSQMTDILNMCCIDEDIQFIMTVRIRRYTR